MGYVEIHVPDKQYQWVMDTSHCFTMDIGVGNIYNYSKPTMWYEFSGWDFGRVVEMLNDFLPKNYVPPVGPVAADVPAVAALPTIAAVKSEYGDGGETSS